MKWHNRITLFGGVVNVNQIHNLDGEDAPCITLIVKRETPRGLQSHYVRVFTPREDLVKGQWIECVGEPVLLLGRFSVKAHNLRILRDVGTRGQMTLALKGGEPCKPGC